MRQGNPLRVSRGIVKVGGPLNPIHMLGKLLTKGTIRPAAKGLKDAAIGVKNLTGPLKNTRLRWKVRDASSLKGYKQISRAELAALPEAKRARVSWLKIGGKRVPAIRKTSFGGVAGAAQRHPFITGGGLLALNELRKSRTKFISPTAGRGEMAALQQQMQPYYQPLPSSGGNF